jgi:hypothetical protein
MKGRLTPFFLSSSGRPLRISVCTLYVGCDKRSCRFYGVSGAMLPRRYGYALGGRGANRRPGAVERRRALERMSHVKDGLLVEGAADDLQANRQPAGEAARHRDPRQSGDIDRDRVNVGQVHLQWVVGLLSQPKRGRRRDRPNERVEPRQGRVMTHRELIARAATWLIALLIGILGIFVFTTVRAGACDRSVSVSSWFQRLHDWTNTSPRVRFTTRAMTPIRPEAPGTSVASHDPRPVTSKSHSATAETREPGRIDPFMPLVRESGTPGKILAPSLPTSRSLQAVSASPVPGETLQLPPAGGVQPSHGLPRRTGATRASERLSRDENMSVLLDMLGRAISGGMDVLNREYRGAHAASVSDNTFLSAGQAPSADRSTRFPGVPIPPALDDGQELRFTVPTQHRPDF